jgi:peptide chain release factor subunit 1
MKLTNLIKKLGSFEPDGYPFLSLYINAEADSTGRDNFQIWLKKQLSEQASIYKDNAEEADRFDKVTEKINEYIENEVEARANGIAIFANLGDSKFFEAVQFDIAFPESRMFNFDRPHIFPLVKAVEQNPKYAVLWADTNKADIYVFGGENRIRTDSQADDKVENIQNTVTNRTSVGGWSQARFQRHIENYHLHHAKEIVVELEEVMDKMSIDHLILCGDETTIMPTLRPQLPKALEEKVIGTLNMSQYDSVEDIKEKTREVFGIENAVRDQQYVQRVHDAANAAAGMGTLGAADTLRALSNGQVQELVISSDFETIEFQPGEIEKILAEYAPGEDRSAVDTLPIVSIEGEVADELITRAINSDAKIIFVEDPSLLKDAGGVGAILRYSMNATANV